MISVVIITRNEEANIKACLESVQTVADEIVVVDAGSTDRTEEICRGFDVRFVTKDWINYSANKNFANELATHPYILSLDADERLSAELRTSILDKKDSLSGVFEFSRQSFYCGKWIRRCGWYPDYKVRLFPKDGSQWVGEFVHERLHYREDASLQRLAGDLIHYTNYSLDDHLERIDRYSSLHAQSMLEKGKRASWYKLLFSPLYRFLKMYVLQQGFREGYLGFQLSIVSAFAVFLRYAKLKRLTND
ncbi:MAG: glycosyltransferase family 2 protein [Bacteroidota bacterium]